LLVAHYTSDKRQQAAIRDAVRRIYPCLVRRAALWTVLGDDDRTITPITVARAIRTT